MRHLQAWKQEPSHINCLQWLTMDECPLQSLVSIHNLVHNYYYNNNNNNIIDNQSIVTSNCYSLNN